jgi:hypothetical protein
MRQTTMTTVIGTGKVDLPIHLRGRSILEHGAQVEVLQHNPGGDPQKVRIRCRGREYDVEKRYVSEALRR